VSLDVKIAVLTLYFLALQYALLSSWEIEIKVVEVPVTCIMGCKVFTHFRRLLVGQ
jgi:hypothetical protein